MATKAKDQAPKTDPGARTGALYGFGMLLLFVGERLVGAGPGRAWSALGVAALLGAFVWRVVRLRAAEHERKQVEQILAALYAVGLFTILLYGLGSDLGAKLLGQGLDRSSPKLATALSVLWPALFVPHAIAVILVEMAAASVWRAPRIEVGRIHAALFAGLGLGAALVFAFATMYSATQRNRKADLSYFRVARPGEATHKIVSAFSENVTVYLFFPPANEVGDQVTSYFDALKGDTPNLEVKLLDQAIDVVKAKELNVSANGTIVVTKGARKEPLFIGTELENARTPLRNLDKDVQKRLLQVGRPGKTVYLVTGHDERSFENVGEGNKRATIRELREAMTQANYTVKVFGAADGLASDVPQDASLVMVLGPEKPLIAEEIAALQRYFDRGGRLFIALDPDSAYDGNDLLAGLGLKTRRVTLASDQVFFKRSHQASDRYNIVTATFTSHPSVMTVSKLGAQAPVGTAVAQALEELKPHKKELVVNFTMRSHASVWEDKDGNFQFDQGETRKAWELAAAVAQKAASGKPEDESRAIVVGDSDFLTDGTFVYNQYFVGDGVRWLVGDDAISGETNSEVDLPIQHTKGKDQVWFYSTVMLMPALVLLVGWSATRNRRRASGSRGKGQQS